MHQPVLLEQSIEALTVEPGKWYVDATFGRGGHTHSILKKKGNVIAFDFDREAITFGRQQFASFIQNKQLFLVRENFTHLKEIVSKFTDQCQVSGILFDFGTSSNQLLNESRGFSFNSNTELDMRMDDRLGVKAKDLLAIAPEKQLQMIFSEYGGETQAKQIAKRIISLRNNGTFITNTQQLATLVSSVKHKAGHLHPATKVFQALRITINNELNNIEQALSPALEILEQQGKIVTISFHEGEDRIVKTMFKKWEGQHRGTIITKKPITPTKKQIQQNNKARSAKLRIFEKNTK